MASNEQRLSLTGSVSLGTGVMIGAGIFALVGQVSETAGALMPLAFLAGAVVSAFSAYSYVVYSRAHPSSGGIAMVLKAAYGPGVIAGSFSLFMYVSMVVAESLLARTFGTYALRPFDLADSALLVPMLGVAVIAVAALVNLVGTGLVERSATATATIKIVGIGALAVAGIVAAGTAGLTGIFATDSNTPEDAGGVLGFLAGVTLCVLAYKGFTTITNQGDDIRDASKNLPRSIAISIAGCAVLYLLLTVAVASSLDVGEIIEARDYALAASAEPLFGSWGVRLTIALALVATFSGLLASIYSVSRLYDMLQDMGQAPSPPFTTGHPALFITVGLAMVTTVFLDLGRIASMGALLYLSMDIAIHWGVMRRLADDLDARRWVPAVAIVLDAVILVAFVVVKARTDLLVLVVAASVAGAIVAMQWLLVHRREEDDEDAAPQRS